MPRFSTLESVERHVWDEITAAAESPGHPYRQLTFATVANGSPTLRTVVLRAAREDERVLTFHTDRRSQKVAAIEANEYVAWCGWNAEARQQIRLRGTASVHRDDAVATNLWQDESPASLVHYVRPSAPGTALDEPGDGLGPMASSESIDETDVAEGRPHFAAIRTVLTEIDWLHLHPEGHYRARFSYQEDDSGRRATWVVP